MTDVPLAALIISNVLTFTAGALPVVGEWVREGRKDKRERAARSEAKQSRLAQEKRRLCVTLIHQAREFRVLMQDAEDCRDGDVLAKYAKEIRNRVPSMAGQADDVGVLVPTAKTAAVLLATEAGTLAAAIMNTENRHLGQLNTQPNYAEFDKCLAGFIAAAADVLNDPAAIAVGSGDKPALALRQHSGTV
jgi:hypothetical protein